MSVVVTVTVPAESFALSEALAADPDVIVDAERVASHSPEWALPFLWASGDDLGAFGEAVRDDPTVANASVVEEAGGEALFKIEWSDEVLGLITDMINQHAIILEAEARADEWRLRLRFAEEAQVSSFREHFAERGHRFEVVNLYRPSAPRQREYGLTPEQREALVAALQGGYFDVPRALPIEGLADRLGISSNAASQRLRRASANLVRHTLTIDAEEA